MVTHRYRRRPQWRAAVAIASVLLAATLSSCSSGGGGFSSATCGTSGPGLTTASVRQLVHQACAEGSLNINYYAGGTNAEVPLWEQGFRAYYGLPSGFSISNYANPDEVTTTEQITSEVQSGHSPEFDVMIVSANFVGQMEHAGVLARGVFNGLPNLVGYTENDGTDQAFYSAIGGFTYNSQKIPPSSAPTSWRAVLGLGSNLEVVSTPYATFNGALPSLWGTHDALVYNQLLASRPRFTTINCGSELSLVTSPAAIMVSDCGNSAADTLAAQGKPVAQVVPTDGAILSQQYLAIPRNDPHSAAAALWVNYLLTRPAQDILWNQEKVDYWRLPGSHIAAQLVQYSSQGWKIVEVAGNGPTNPTPANISVTTVPPSAVGSFGGNHNYFLDANMAENAAEYAHGFQNTTACIIQILKGSSESVACDPYRNDIRAAHDTAPSTLP